ncbi:MAG TPA: hypothetical protein VG963_30215, partial [Polyangiaceae bacterium]|nr:hypothetical protein [Polyangiaceae bacterium]
MSLGLLGSLYLASGALGLIYEVAFSKYLGLSFGATAAASSAVLVAFMGGLALGAHLTGRFERHVRRPLFWYGSVELSIGLFCLLAPTLFARLTPVYVLLAAHTHSLVLLSVVRGLLAMSIVAVPAIGMGSTLPLLARFIHGAGPGEDAAANRKLATLYGVNTLGGALGSLGSAYLILPYLGLSLTVRSCAGASISIGLLALLLGRRERTTAVPGRPKAISSQPADGSVEAPDSISAARTGTATVPGSAASSSSASASEVVASSAATSSQGPSSDGLSAPDVAGARLTPNQAYALAALSGLLVFSCEVIATHLLALVIGTSVYAFGLMLAIFLICLSLGTPLARWLERRLGGSALSISLA